MGEYEWLEKKSLRSVDQLRLWADNPRLDPEERHISLSDFASDLITQNGEKDSFLKLINSIATNGFIPADPIVVWQSKNNNKYYVAEGNRRILALKLLRNPEKSPSPIRSYVRSKSALIDRNTIEKIRVSVAPSYDDCEWYINQRHSSSSIQRSWSRLQQQKWVAYLYDKYDKDVEKVISVTGQTKSQLEYTLRILKIRDFALDQRVLSQLTSDEQDFVKSHRIPMTILERWFDNAVVKEKWGYEFYEDDVKIISNKSSFLSAYAQWLKFVIHKDEPDVEIQINTRTITHDLGGILEKLPEVSFDPDETDEEITPSNTNVEPAENNQDQDQGDNTTQNTAPPLNKNPDRNQLVIRTLNLKTSNYKLNAIFEEFKKLPVARYKNCTAASLRVFLDLAISDYIISEGCDGEIANNYQRAFRDVALKYRLEYLKQHKLRSRTPEYKVVEKLLNHTNDHSLDTLNNYIHGSDTHKTDKRFLNGFWDFLFPLLSNILDIEEK